MRLNQTDKQILKLLEKNKPKSFIAEKIGYSGRLNEGLRRIEEAVQKKKGIEKLCQN